MDNSPKDPKDPKNKLNTENGKPEQSSSTRQTKASASTSAEAKFEPAKPTAKAESAAKPEASKSETASATKSSPAAAEGKKSGANTSASSSPPKEPIPPKSAPAAPKPAKEKQPGNGAIYVAIVALLVAMGALVFTGWQWQQDQQLREEKSVATAVLNNQMSELKSSLAQQQASLERRVERGETSVSNARETVLSMQQELAAAQSRAAQRQPTDWQLAEADYLVRMAARKLWLERDANTALALLKDADSRLLAMGETQLTPIRAKLAEDIATVASLPRVDLAGISVKIESLIGRVNALPLNTVQLPDPAELEAEGKVSKSVQDWKANLAKSWHAITDDFITVRRRTGEVEPLLSPEQEWFLRELMKGKLMQAQLAMYHGHDDSYRTALKTAYTWMTEYYKQDDGAVKTAQAELDQLMKAELVKSLPERFTVSADLEGITKQRLSRGVE